MSGSAPKFNYVNKELSCTKEFRSENPGVLPTFDEIGYKWMKTTFDQVRKQFLMFTLARECEIPENSYNWATDQMLDMFKTHNVTSRVLTWGEIEYNPKSSPGVFYKDFYKFKKDYLDHNTEDLARFWNVLGDPIVSSYLSPCGSVAGKEEMQKMSKILEGDQRCFEIFNAPVTLSGNRLFQDLNHKLMKMPWRLPFAVGVTLQYGGFHELMKALDDFDIKWTGDVKKWDKYYGRKLRLAVIRIRRALMKFERTSDRVRFETLYRFLTQTYLMLPWGQIVLVMWAMKSGDPTTTYDNTIGHCILWFTFCHEILGMQNWLMIVTQSLKKIYADDHIGAIFKDYEFLVSYAVRAKFYHTHGFILKLEDDRVQKSVVGLTFLGATVFQIGGKFVPGYNRDRVLASIVTAGQDYDRPVYFLRVISLMYLVLPFPETFKILKNVARFTLKQMTKGDMSELLSPRVWDEVSEEFAFATYLLTMSKLIPNRRDVLTFWTQLESINPDAITLPNEKDVLDFWTNLEVKPVHNFESQRGGSENFGAPIFKLWNQSSLEQ